MTQPDESMPPIFGAVTHPGLAQWAALTQQDWEEWMRDSVKTHIDPLGNFINLVQKSIDDLGDLLIGIIDVITGGHATGDGIREAIAALQTLVGWVNDLRLWIGKLFDGLAGIAGATVEQAVAAFTNLAKQFWDFIHGLVGGSGTIAQAVAFIKGIQTAVDQAVANLAALVDGIWKAFTGGTSVGHSVTEAVNAITSWLMNSFQRLVDGIVGIITPGAIGSPVLDAINAIGSIFGVASNADANASQAQADIEAIKAGQAGGFSDTFDYPLATTLPTADWQKKTTILDTYGPNGAGSAVGVVAGTATGEVRYVQISKPLTNANMKCTAVLSRPPWWDLFVKSGWYLMVQCNSANRECYSVEIMNDQCQFQMLSTTGAVAKLGSAIAIPANAAGVPYTLEFKDGTLSLIRNGILAASHAGCPTLSGRMIGFGSYKSAYTNATDNPLAQFAGISWQ